MQKSAASSPSSSSSSATALIELSCSSKHQHQQRSAAPRLLMMKSVDKAFRRKWCGVCVCVCGKTTESFFCTVEKALLYLLLPLSTVCTVFCGAAVVCWHRGRKSRKSRKEPASAPTARALSVKQ